MGGKAGRFLWVGGWGDSVCISGGPRSGMGLHYLPR